MTEAQIQTIKALYEDYKKHLYDNSSYGSDRYCQFIVFENNTIKRIIILPLLQLKFMT